MPWPTSQDYNEAVQNPQTSFNDPELRQGQVVVNARGIPQPCSGNFADVYAIECPATRSKWAVKCFTRHVPGLDERYHQISYYLRRVHLPFLVDFTYLNRGICVGGDWYPVLKMQWVEGFTLNQFVKDHLDKPQALEDLGQLWLKLASRLRESDMAHRDLQHGNVLLVPGRKVRSLRVKLVDYDGIWVPALASVRSVEVGHPAYQHPQRQREGISSPEVDQFSHLVIYTALRGLVVGGRDLWEKYDNGDNLLFTREDLEAPSKSRLFYDLLKLDDPTARCLAESLIDAARRPLDQTPLLLEALVTVERSAPRLSQRERGRIRPMAVGPALWSRVPPPVRSYPAEPVEVPPTGILSVPASPHPEPLCLPPCARRFALGLLAIGLTTLAGVIVAAILLTASDHAPSGEVAASRSPVEMPRHHVLPTPGEELPLSESSATTSRVVLVEPPTQEKPDLAPVFKCRELFERAGELNHCFGKRVVVVGPVRVLRTTGLSHRLFWEVPEGLGVVGLSDGPKEDRVQVQCAFQGGWPAPLTVGTSCRIEGTFRGVIVTAGVPLLVDCELADEG